MLINVPHSFSLPFSCRSIAMGNTNETTCHVKETFSVRVIKKSADGAMITQVQSASREYVQCGGSKTLPPLSVHGEFGKMSGGISAGRSSALAIEK